MNELYPIIRRKRRPLIRTVAAPVTGVPATPAEEIGSESRRYNEPLGVEPKAKKGNDDVVS